jgi:tetratricopeptide (TPR) repeat protein
VRLAFAFSASLALAACLAPAVARGAEPATAERALRLSEEGAELYKAHDYRRAIEKYATAYELDPDPNLLYNQGKCYEALGDYPAAKDKYGEFLSKPNGDVNARKKATDFVAKFNAGGAGAAPGEAASARPAAAEGASDAPSSGSALRPVGFGLLGAGVLGAAAGGYFFFKGRAALSDVKDAPGYGEAGNPDAVAPLTEAEAQKKIDDGTRQRTLGGILLGAGAGLAAVGVALVIVAPKRAPAPAAALNVAPLPGGGYATLRATF